MSAISFNFPYRIREFDDTRIAYPEIAVELHTFIGKRIHYFIMDTGADTTTLPEYMIDILNVPENELTRSRSFGVSGTTVDSQDAVIYGKIGTVGFDMPVTFVPSKDVPLLLGKQGIFDRFNIYFDNDNQKTVLTRRG